MGKKVRDKSQILFYVVIGCATLILLTVGASFAWFNATVGSSDDQQIVTSGTLLIDYSEGSKILLDDMIPATEEQVSNAYSNNDCVYTIVAASCTGGTATGNETSSSQCSSVNGSWTPAITDNICSSYSFTVTNEGTLSSRVLTDIDLIIPSGANAFTTNAVRYIIFEDTTWRGTSQILDVTSPAINNYILSPTESKTYTIVFWLDGITATNTDQDKVITGTITVNGAQTNA
ncbi:MAG: hypothetical protein Q4G04_00025 [bacterium]|nr:hypothetical protein [bacterium]